jgi:hypothetical protein
MQLHKTFKESPEESKNLKITYYIITFIIIEIMAFIGIIHFTWGKY